jgi:hypothetical protein
VVTQFLDHWPGLVESLSGGRISITGSMAGVSEAGSGCLWFLLFLTFLSLFIFFGETGV